MKRIVALFVVLVMLASLFSVSAVGAETVSRPYEIMEEFVTLHPYRESGTDGNIAASAFLKSFFEKIGYDVEEQVFSFNLQGHTYGVGEPVEDRNIIAKKDVGASSTVIVGAHFDNVFSSGNGQGAYDNGSGIGVMLALAESLYSKNLDYNAVFCAFGGEEYGLYGSKHYLDSLSALERENILLYVNVDSVSAGDNLYIYCDEVKSLHESYFMDAIGDLGLNILLTPEYKPVAGVYNYGDKLPYTHTGLASDNATFFNAGVMTVNFSAYTWEKDDLEQVNESLTHENIMHTERDNIETIEELYGDSAREKMDAVYTLLLSTMTHKDFSANMAYAKANNPNYELLSRGTLAAIVSLVILVALSVIVWVYVTTNKKKYGDKNPRQEERREKPPEVFSDF